MDTQEDRGYDLPPVPQPLLESGEKTEERKFYVYVLRRPDRVDPFDENKGCPFYVGKGSNKRIKHHKWQASSIKNKIGRKFYKINIIHFLWEQGLDYEEDILCENLPEKESFDLEIELILTYGRIDKGTGTLANFTDGGEGASGHIVSNSTREKLSQRFKGKKQSKEACKKNSECHKGIPSWNKGKKMKPLSTEHRKKLSKAFSGSGNPRYGVVLSEEVRRKISKSHQGKSLSEEHRHKISETNKGRIASEETRKKLSISLSGENNPMYGKHIPHSEETRKKISESNKGKPKSEEHRKKLSEANKGKTSPRLGVTLSLEIRKKVSEGLKRYFAQKREVMPHG